MFENPSIFSKIVSASMQAAQSAAGSNSGAALHFGNASGILDRAGGAAGTHVMTKDEETAIREILAMKRRQREEAGIPPDAPHDEEGFGRWLAEHNRKVLGADKPEEPEDVPPRVIDGPSVTPEMWEEMARPKPLTPEQAKLFELLGLDEEEAKQEVPRSSSTTHRT
jgi:hypothetical protein